MNGLSDDDHSGADHRGATPEELFAWVARRTGAQLRSQRQISGGNRCQSWAVELEPLDGAPRAVYLRYQPPRPPSAEPYTVWREAVWYRAIAGRSLPAPELIAVHDEVQALITTLAPGRADFRHLAPQAAQRQVIDDFIDALVALHLIPAPSGPDGRVPDMAAAVAEELAIWDGMYRECGQSDLLIEVALRWLRAAVPPLDLPAVVVHGDAGPGNFLFENDRMTALVDWELAHAGDPMEDLAWFSMRATLEPVPDFIGALHRYAAQSAAPLALDRLRYHRVFVAARVCIIRLRNVTGISGNSILSRAVNRWLLITALAEAAGIMLPVQTPLAAPETALTPLYDELIAQMQDPLSTRGGAEIAAVARPAARVLKYLRENDRLGPGLRMAQAQARQNLVTAQGCPDTDAALAALPLPVILPWLAAFVARDNQLSALASGSLAGRRFPPLEDIR